MIAPWKPRKNAKPPSADQLREQLATEEANLAALDREAEIVGSDIPNLVGTPRYSEAQAHLSDVEAKRAVARGMIQNLQDGIIRAEQREAEAAKAAAEAEEDRHHAEAERLAEAHKALHRDKLPAAMEAVVALLQEDRRMLQAIEERNAARGARPFIPDGETRLRGKPARTEPAQFREEEVWIDGSGRRATVFRRNAAGEDVPEELGFEKKQVKVQVRSERFLPPELPGGRVADACVLVDPRSGRQIWPR